MDGDLILSKNKIPYIIDLNPRFGGGYPITHTSGVNYLEALIAESCGKEFHLPDYGRNVCVMKGISIYTRIRSYENIYNC